MKPLVNMYFNKVIVAWATLKVGFLKVCYDIGVIQEVLVQDNHKLVCSTVYFYMLNIQLN